MILAVVGSRSLDSNDEAKRMAKAMIAYTLSDKEAVLYVSGGAVGPDKWGEEVADGLGIEKKIFYPNWSKYGRSAGFRRNQTIVKTATFVMIFWDGVSKGTKHDIDLCKQYSTEHILFIWNNEFKMFCCRDQEELR